MLVYLMCVCVCVLTLPFQPESKGKGEKGKGGLRPEVLSHQPPYIDAVNGVVLFVPSYTNILRDVDGLTLPNA